MERNRPWTVIIGILLLILGHTLVSASLLPNTIIPIHYDLEIKPDFYGNPGKFTQTCITDIHIKCVSQTHEVKFHSRDLKINWKKSFLRRQDAKRTLVQKEGWTYDEGEQMWTLKTKNALVKDGEYVLHLESSAPIKVDGMFGLYASKHREDGKSKYVISVQSQPVFARMIFPCFDEPGLKATFNVTIWRKVDFAALSNMPLLHTKDKENDWVADTFQKTPRQSTYTLSMVVSDFDLIQTVLAFNGKNLTVTLWASSKHIYTKGASELNDHSINIFSTFQEYLRVSYPLPKLDQVAIPSFPVEGGMEGWGLITFSEESLFTPRMSTVRGNIAHEIAHQWFGNLVTMSNWGELWLNEALASYLYYLAPDQLDPLPISAKRLTSAMESDSYVESLPVIMKAETYPEIMAMFGDAVYRKAPYIVRMLHNVIGDKAMRLGLERYLFANKYNSTTTQNFCDSIHDAKKAVDHQDFDVANFLMPWLKQRNHPLITVSKKKKGLSITQTPFVKTGAPYILGGFILENYFTPSAGIFGGKYDEFGYKWDIPLTIMTKSEIKVQKKGGKIRETIKKLVTSPDIIWMSRNNITLDNVNGEELKDNDWVLVDPDMFGFFRTNYDTRLWKNLLNQLIVNYQNFTLAKRRQIVYDVMEYTKLDMLSPDIPLLLGNYVLQTLDPYQWELFLNGTQFFADILQTTNRTLYSSFKKYMEDLMKPARNDLKQSSSSLRQLLSTWSCRYGDKDGCHIETYGNETVSGFLTKSIKGSKNQTKIKAVIERVIQDGYTSDVLELYVTNLSFFHSRAMHGLLPSIVKTTASTADAEKVKKAERENPLLDKTWKEEFQVSVKIIDENIQWYKKSEKKIAELLKKYTKT